MNDNIRFILKVFLLSIVLSLLIKYFAPGLSIPANTWIALMAVLMPTLILGGLLGRMALLSTRKGVTQEK